MMPTSTFQGSGPASSNQTSALGMNSLQVGPMGSPTMNRMETGGDPGLAERERQERDRGVAGNSGAAMQANAQGANTSNNTCSELSWTSWELSWKCTAHLATASVRKLWTSKGWFNGPTKLWDEPTVVRNARSCCMWRLWCVKDFKVFMVR